MLSRLMQPGLDRVWVILIGLIVAAPLVSGGLPSGYDAGNHLLRVEILVESLQAGMLYPRWMPDLHLGYGAPLLTFYAPSAYFLAAGFGLLGMSGDEALRWTTIVLVAVSGLGVWQLTDSVYASADRGRRWAALIAATAYSAGPYLVFNATTRMAIPELMAQALVPWVLWALRGLLLATEPGRYRAPLATSLAAVFVSHTVSIVITPVFVGVAAVGYAAIALHRSRPNWRLAWVKRWSALIGAGLLALALSGWFWLPLVVERQNLGTEQYLKARSGEPYLPVSIDQTFTAAWPYPRNSTVLVVPISVWLVALAAVGVWLHLRQRQGEALVYVGLAIMALIGHWPIGLPLLTASGVDQLIQFPWRLQTWVYLPAAVLAGGAVVAVRGAWPRRVLALTIIAFLLVGGVPIGLKRILFHEPQPTTPEAMVAFAEGSVGLTSFGLTADQEFLPVWVRDWPESMRQPERATLPAGVEAEVRLITVGPLERVLEITASAPFSLTLTDYYFPGWQASLNGVTAVVQPAPTSGLLRLSIPAGTSQVRVGWSPTMSHHLALGLTLVGIGAAVWLTWPHRRRSPASATLALVWAAPAILLAWPVAAAPGAVAPGSSVTIGPDQAAQLLAVQTHIRERGALIEAHWWVRAPLDDYALVWRLRGPDGTIVQTVNSRPYFDQLVTTAWPAPGLIDDRVFVPWPAGQPPARYTLSLCAQPASTRQPVCDDDQVVAEVEAPATGPAPVSAATLFGPACTFCLQPVSGRPAGLAELVGIGFQNWQRPLPPPSAGLLVVTPQDGIEVVLAWRSLTWMDDRYNSTVLMTTPDGKQVSYSDHIWTTTLSNVRQWAPSDYRLDYHTLYPDDDIPSGVYPVRVGIFDLQAGGFVDWTTDSGEPLGDTAMIASVKWLNPPRAQPTTRLDVPLGEFARISGITLSGTRARPGETLSLIVYARADGPASRDLTRFVHVYNGQGGLIAQADGTPGGTNSTSSWQPGEIVADPVSLSIAPDAAAGVYRLLLGYYDPATGERAAVGAPDNVVLLAEINVE